MTNPQRLAALALAASVAACGEDAAVQPGLLLSEPSAVAVFRGNVASATSLQPYIAIANAESNDLTLVDAVTNVGVPAPVPLRPLVVPVPGRPTLLASADLGDGGADLLVAVSAGDPRLQVIETWDPDLAISGVVPLDGDVVALAALPGAAPGQARIAAALSGRQLAIVTFGRAGDGIAPLGMAVSGLTFQPVALAVLPGDPPRLWAATQEALPGGLLGVAELDPAIGAFVRAVEAGAPTRLVAAARLAERGAGEAGLDPATWATTAPAGRVYAVLDESGCGLDAPIACGLVALDADGAGPAPDFVNPSNPRAPIPIPGRPLALAASGPPALPPSDAPADQIYAPPFMRMVTSLGARTTTGAAAVASTDGGIYFVDLGRWELPSNQLVHETVVATATSAGAPGSSVDQWLVLARDDGSPISHLDPTGLATWVTVTPGFTPTARWTVTHEGVLPGLGSRRAQAGNDGAPWLALQTGSETLGFGEVVRVYDPTLGVRVGDTVIVDPTGVATCTAPFEVTVADLVEPIEPRYPGGAVRLSEKDAGNAAWHACFTSLSEIPLDGLVTGLRATFRAGGPSPYVLVREMAGVAVHAGRPSLGAPFAVEAADEGTFAACVGVPPAAPWPPDPDDVPTCGAGCRDDCQDLLRARLGRRIGYVPETCGTTDARCQALWEPVTDVAGPALGLTLALETAADPPRDLSLAVETLEGRSPSRTGDPLGAGVDARSVVAFDRSPYSQGAGIRFLVPYASDVVVDTSPTNGSTAALR